MNYSKGVLKQKGDEPDLLMSNTSNALCGS